MSRFFGSGLIAAVSLVCACRLDYGIEAATGAEPPPTARFIDYSHTVVLRGARNLELRASRADAYEADKKVVLVDVNFAEYDPDTGELVSSGIAERAVFFTETEDAEFSGSVRLESKRQDVVLEGEYLRWDSKAKRLEGRLDRTVNVTRGDGSRISGAGFEADAKSRSIVYRGSVEGRIMEKREEEPIQAAGSASAPSRADPEIEDAGNPL